MCKKAVSSVIKVGSLGLVDVDKMLKPPSPPELPKAPDAPPAAQDAGVDAAREDEKRRRLAASGQGSTILTGPNGVTSAASTGAKTLLGA